MSSAGAHPCLDAGDGRGGNVAAELIVDRRVERVRFKRGIQQIANRLDVDRFEVRPTKETIHRLTGAVVRRRIVDAAGGGAGGIAAAEDGIQIPVTENKPRIVHASIHEVIVVVAGV